MLVKLLARDDLGLLLCIDGKSVRYLIDKARLSPFLDRSPTLDELSVKLLYVQWCQYVLFIG